MPRAARDRVPHQQLGELRRLPGGRPDRRLGATLDLFDHVVESSRVGVRKPDRRFYEIACEMSGVEPAEVVFLDDLGVNLKPAAAMGMTTIKVVDPDRRPPCPRGGGGVPRRLTPTQPGSGAVSWHHARTPPENPRLPTGRAATQGSWAVLTAPRPHDRPRTWGRRPASCPPAARPHAAGLAAGRCATRPRRCRRRRCGADTRPRSRATRAGRRRCVLGVPQTRKPWLTSRFWRARSTSSASRLEWASRPSTSTTVSRTRHEEVRAERKPSSTSPRLVPMGPTPRSAYSSRAIRGSSTLSGLASPSARWSR